MRRSIVAVAALLIGTVAASADPKADFKACIKSEPDIAACDRVIRNPKESRDNLASAHYVRGTKALEKADYEAALADLDQSIALNKSNDNAYYNRALTLRHLGQYERALSDMGRYIDANPNEPEAYVERGLIYFEKGDRSRARAEQEHALAIAPEHPLALLNRGRVLTELGQFDAAHADFAAAERRKIGMSMLTYRGWTYFYQADYDKAQADFEKLFAANSNDVEAVNGLCRVHARKREFEKAVPHCDAAVRLEPKEAVPLHSRGLTKFEMGAPGIALADFDEAIRIKAHAYMYADRGKAHEARGDRALAVADYQRAVTLPSTGYYDDITKAEALQRLTALATAAPQAAAVPQQPTEPAAPERRVALVIGNSAYTSVPALLNPRNDARAVAASLKRLGFAAVMEEYDLTRAGMTAALQKFGELADDADWAVIYYAGHGIEIGGVNYAIPVDAALKAATHVEDEAVPQERVMATVGNAKKMRLVILDACRDNPFVPKMRTSGGTRSVGRGLARVDPPPGVLLAYAARDGLTAMDGETGNSPFASALVEHLEEPGVEINLLFRKVRDAVFRSTRGRQEPFTYGSLPAQQFFFRTAQP